jgi:hypothetical protein
MTPSQAFQAPPLPGETRDKHAPPDMMTKAEWRAAYPHAPAPLGLRPAVLPRTQAAYPLPDHRPEPQGRPLDWTRYTSSKGPPVPCPARPRRKTTDRGPLATWWKDHPNGTNEQARAYVLTLPLHQQAAYPGFASPEALRLNGPQTKPIPTRPEEPPHNA